MHRLAAATCLSTLACVGQPDPAEVDGAPAASDGAAAGADAAGAGVDAAAGPCPADMVAYDGVCFDRFEAPNRAGEPPLVMYSFDEAEAWCGARGKRLCFDDEWTGACAGPAGSSYPYGDTHQPGVCNDEEIWRVYDQDLLNGWPAGVGAPGIESLDALWVAAAAVGPAGAAAVDHLKALYQGEPAGDNPGCAGPSGVRDLVGNVEEWTRRRDGGMPQFHGSLKGRYWAESRTCQSAVISHGDGFRFYEIGFRCCRVADRAGPR